MSNILNLLKSEGTLGILSIPDLRNKYELSFHKILINGSRIVGSLSGSKSDLRDLINFTIKTKIYPDIKEMKFSQIGDALEML